MYTNIKDENNLKSIFFYKNYIYIYKYNNSKKGKWQICVSQLKKIIKK